MEGCVEGALEARAGPLSLGKREVVVMSFVLDVESDGRRGDGESRLQCIANW